MQGQEVRGTVKVDFFKPTEYVVLISFPQKNERESQHQRNWSTSILFARRNSDSHIFTAHKGII